VIVLSRDSLVAQNPVFRGQIREIRGRKVPNRGETDSLAETGEFELSIEN
jgi:hypothetical protein